MRESTPESKTIISPSKRHSKLIQSKTSFESAIGVALAPRDGNEPIGESASGVRLAPRDRAESRQTRARGCSRGANATPLAGCIGNHILIGVEGRQSTIENLWPIARYPF